MIILNAEENGALYEEAGQLMKIAKEARENLIRSGTLY